MRLGEAFDVLGVPESATIDEVRAAHRKRAKETHPDAGGSAREFIQVQAAYEILCGFFQADSGDPSIDVPEELRAIIDDLVRSFRQYSAKSETLCDEAFDAFDKSIREHIQMASRGDLKHFSDTFRSGWNTLITNLFQGFNTQSRELVRKYESWFDHTMEDTFEEMYKAELKGYRSSPRFYVYGVALFAVGVWIAVAGNFQPTFLGYVERAVAAIAPLAALPFVYWIDCYNRKKSPAEVRTLSIAVFHLDSGAEFQGSAALKQGTRNTVTAGLAGAAIGDLISRGIGVPFVGLAAGLVVGGVVDRIAHPTATIRSAILAEYEQLMEFARPQITAYVVEHNRKLMNDIQADIERSYKDGVRKTVLMLAAQN